MTTNAEAAKAEEPKAEEPKAEEAKVDEAKVEEAKVDEPKIDEPKADEPKVDEPKAGSPEVKEAEAKAKPEPQSSQPFSPLKSLDAVTKHLCKCGADIGDVLQENMKSAADLARSLSPSSMDVEAADAAAPDAGSEKPASTETSAEQRKVREAAPPAPAAAEGTAAVAEAGKKPATEEDKGGHTSVEEELAALREELDLKNRRILSLQKTRATLMATIENSARKLIPSAIAAKDEVIATLEEELAAARKETEEAKESAAAKDKESASVREERASKEKEITTMAAAISSLEDAVAAKDAELDGRSRDIAARDEAIAGHLAALAGKEEEAAAREQTVAEEAAARERAVAERDAALEADRKCIMSLERELAGALKRLADTKNPLSHLELYIGMKDERIAALEARLGDKDAGEGEKAPAKAGGEASKKGKAMEQTVETPVVDDARDDMEAATADDAVAVSVE